MKKENCAYYDNGYCRKGLPGTKCEIVGCVASIPKPVESTMIHYPSTSPIDYWYQKYLKEKLTWQDVAIILTIYVEGVENGKYKQYADPKRLKELLKEYSEDVLREFVKIKKHE